jgi:hypothetical protein
MKSIKIKLFVTLAFVGITFSCSKDALREYDTVQQLNAKESLNDPFLLSSILKQTCKYYSTQGFSTTSFPGAVQYIEMNYQGGDNYYSSFKQPSTNMYDAINIIGLIDSSIKLTTSRDSKSYTGIFTIFRVMLFEYMTACYGDVYYSQALKARDGILYPKYDKQADIYAGLVAELENAVTLIQTGTETIDPSYDLMFGGDKTKWVKLCNSLKIRLLMRESGKLSDIGAKLTSVAGASLMSVVDDNAKILFTGTTTDNSWSLGTLNDPESSNFDRSRPCKTLVDTMLALNDPRVAILFAPVENPWTTNPALNGTPVSTIDPNGFSYTSTWEYVDPAIAAIKTQIDAGNILDKDKLYTGFIAGMPGDWKNGNGHYNTAAGGTFGNFKVSKFSNLFRQNKHALLQANVMSADEVQFDLAEAAAKGWISGDVNAYYTAGVTAALKRWGVADADITAYLAQSAVKLPSDAAGKLRKIAVQKWLGLFGNAPEAYFDIRRTQLPNIFNNGYLLNYQFPVRLRYPSAELGQNLDAYNLGISTLSPATDDQYAKMWLLQ